MKYLLIILSILCAVSLLTLIAVWPEKQSATDDTVVTINGQPVSRQSIQSFREKNPHHGSDEDFLNEIITQQLLIVEAQRLGIDKEPTFRTALKNYYEHSLIKILMDRISNNSDVQVSDAEIDTYLSCFGQRVTFYTLQSSSTVSAETIKADGQIHTSLFDDLSDTLQMTLAGLQPQQTASTYLTGNDKINVYLEKKEGDASPGQNIDREKIRRQLHQAKVEQHINSWIEDLRKNATITYPKT